MDMSLDRKALYYPYIYIRDINWLKGTLLCFPQVRRMVPKTFLLHDLLRDPPSIQEYRETEGLNGEPLLVEENLDNDFVISAQHRLLNKIRDNEGTIIERYSLEATERTRYSLEATERARWEAMYQTYKEDFFDYYYQQYHDCMQRKVRPYQIYERELEFMPIIEQLLKYKLAWPSYVDSRWSSIYRPVDWCYEVHPKLGEALMSVIAIAIARAKGLDIVTSDLAVHIAVASQDEEMVFNDLLGLGFERHEPDPRDVADEIAVLVLTTKFDLDRLNAKQIAELIKDGKDLRKFKDALVPIAARIPEILDPVERRKQLEDKAREVINEWEKYKKTLPGFAIDALVGAAGVTLPNALLTAIGAATNPLIVVGGVGIGIAIGMYQACKLINKLRENISNPYQYLSYIAKAGAALVTPPVPTRQ